MPITMYNKETGKNVKVYGFVHESAGFYSTGHTYAIIYDLNTKKLFERTAADIKNKPFEYAPEDLEMKLVDAKDLRPLEI